MITTDAPTVSGYYWFLAPRCNPEVVHVVMEYTSRGKVVPFLIAMGWRCPLVKSVGQWSEKIKNPFGA